MSDGDAMKGKVTLTLQQDGGAVAGAAGSDQGQMKILNGKLDGDKLRACHEITVPCREGQGGLRGA